MDNPVVFLGGTCNDDMWRDVVMDGLAERNVPYFNPVVDDWNEEAQKKEDEIKNKPDTIQLFVITSKMTGVFSIAEVVAAAYTDDQRTVFGVCREGFTESQLKSLDAVLKLVGDRGAITARGSRDFVLSSVASMAASAWKRFQPVTKGTP